MKTAAAPTWHKIAIIIIHIEFITRILFANHIIVNIAEQSEQRLNEQSRK